MDGIQSLFRGLRWEFSKFLVQFICSELITNSCHIDLSFNLSEAIELIQLLISELVLLSDGEGSYDENLTMTYSLILKKLRESCKAQGLTVNVVMEYEEG